MQSNDISHIATLDALQRLMERCTASAEELERALDSLGPGSDLKAALPAKIQFDTDELVLRAFLDALVYDN